MTQELKYYSSRINSVSTGPIELEVEPGRSAPFLEMAGGMRLLLLWRFIVAVALVQVWSAGFGGEWNLDFWSACVEFEYSLITEV